MARSTPVQRASSAEVTAVFDELDFRTWLDDGLDEPTTPRA